MLRSECLGRSLVSELPFEKGPAGKEADLILFGNMAGPQRGALDPHPLPPLPRRAARSLPIIETQDATPFDEEGPTAIAFSQLAFRRGLGRLDT